MFPDVRAFQITLQIAVQNSVTFLNKNRCIYGKRLKSVNIHQMTSWIFISVVSLKLKKKTTQKRGYKLTVLNLMVTEIIKLALGKDR